MRALTRITKQLAVAGVLSRFAMRNLWCGRRVRPFPKAEFGSFVIEPLSQQRLDAVERLYSDLSEGKRLNAQQKLALRLLGPRLCLVASDVQRNDVVAITFFYFNARDRRERTVHAAFNGIHRAAQGAGLGTFMLRHALENFARSGLAGVSSRVSLSNPSALKTNKKAGFVPVETYFDPFIGEERHYLICDLSKYQKDLDEEKGHIADGRS